ncbi:MAG: SdrD B-like domain-containing protein, partial [Acidobacteriota bacterium]
MFDAIANTVTWTALGPISVGSTVTLAVDLTFADPPFSDGQTVTSFVSAVVDPLGEPPNLSVGPDSFDHTLRTFTESPDAAVGKAFGAGRPANLPPAEGQSFVYNVSIRNTGNIDLDSLVVTDDGDGAGADIDAGLTIDGVGTGAYGAGYTGLVTVSYTTNLAPAAVLGASPGNVDAFFPIPALGAGERVTRIEWSFAGPIPAGMGPTSSAQVSATVNAGFPAGTTIDNHVTADWTATITGICGDPPGPASGSASANRPFDVAGGYTYLRPTKGQSGGPYFPGDTVAFSLGITNDALANDPASGVVVTDLLPEFLTFQSASETFADNGTGVGLGIFEVIDNYNGTGRTLLRWTLTGDLDPGETVDLGFDAAVELGVIFGSLTNTVGMTYPAGPVAQRCAGGSQVDAADLDGDGDDGDDLCTASTGIPIAAVAQLSSGKFVRGQCDPGFTGGLTTGTSLPGGVVDWRVEVQNVQTVPMQDFVLIDILPFVGDTGVRDTTPRLSLFRPVLSEPVAPPPGGSVFYSLSGNPCRPEVGGPTTGCDAPNWTPIPPTPITDAQSIKVEFGDRVLNPLDRLEFGWREVLPADAPVDGSEAFNSFAFGSIRSDDGGFLGAEPNKVGIDATCVPAPPDDAMLGNFVWIDSDGDGIQDPAEVGLNNVPVQLFDPGPDGLPRTGDDIPVLSSITQDDDLGNPGWYKFSALAPGDYYVLFTPPPNFEVTQRGAGGDGALDSDTDPASACTDVVTLAPSENNPDIDMGLLPPVDASLGNYVWFDRDGDGVQNEALSDGVNGVAVKLFADDGDGNPEPGGDDGTPLQVTVTADDAFGNPGFYRFEELTPGVPYFVQFMLPSPATGFTSRNAGGDDTVDSDAASGNGTTQVVTLAAGEDNPTLDAGLVLLSGDLSLGNLVWCDEDGNGVIDAAGDDDGLYDPLVPEAGINGVRVNLYLDLSGDGLPQVNEFYTSTQTQTLAGKDGRYRFDGLAAGDYIVEVDASNFASGGALEGKVSSTGNTPTPDPDDDADNDDNGDPLGTTAVSQPVTLSAGGEPTPDADDDLEADADINFTVDFGFIPGAGAQLDFGDAPDAGSGTGQGNYRTVAFDGGAQHNLTGPMGPWLGACVDSDTGSAQSFAANADDLAGPLASTFGVCASPGDDEDGVAFSSTLLMLGTTVDITLTSSSAAPCTVNAWIDWNRDGEFDDNPATERVLTDVAAGVFPAIPVPT